MYSEKTFKNYIFWIQVKRVFLMIGLSMIGAAIGVLVGEILESTVKVSTYNTIIIVVSTLVFFVISLLLTANIGKEVQDGYWKIAVLRKLTVIQKSIEVNNELLASSNKSLRAYRNITRRINQEMQEIKDEIDITSELVNPDMEKKNIKGHVKLPEKNVLKKVDDKKLPDISLAPDSNKQTEINK